jgi:hypothetical protein
MATIDFGKAVSLQQAAQLILSVPDNRFMLLGEPGIGKSSILKHLQTQLPTHSAAYIDVPNMDLGDIAMPVVNHDTKITQYYPNARFRLHEGRPVIIMLDEFSKGADPIKNMLHPLLEVANPRLGDVPLPEGSIVFLTGNMSSDGVGDNIKAHTRNRISTLTVRKPDSDAWIAWAVNNNIDPVVMAFVRQFPQCMASYLDGNNEGNPYIFNPKAVQTAYVTPRSMERASNIVKNRSKFDEDALISGLAGTVGEAAARDMEAFIAYQDQLPTWEAITTTPSQTNVPDSPGACAVLIFGAIQKVTKETMSPFMDYLKRFEPEWQAAFAINVAKNPSKQSIAFSSRAFADWVQQNEDLL